MAKKPDKKIGELRSYLLDMPQVFRRGQPAVDEVTLCDLHAKELGHHPEHGLVVVGYCIICGDPEAIATPSKGTGIEEGHELPGPADFDREAFQQMLKEAARSGEVFRERALRVYQSNPQRAREVGWAAYAGLTEEPWTEAEFADALQGLLASWQSGNDEYMERLEEARERCTPDQWATLQLQVTISTGVFPGKQNEGDTHG